MRKVAGILIVVAATAACFTTARAATTGNATVTLSASANTMIQILDPAVTLVPTPADYANDFVDAAGASGLRVQVKTNSATGLVLKVRCPDAAPQIALADLLVKTATTAGTGGTSMGFYTAITAADQNLWSTGTSQHAWQVVTTDIRIQNINAYDAPAVGTTNYTNTLTYTVVAQ
jgi:hypothetical protein